MSSNLSHAGSFLCSMLQDGRSLGPMFSRVQPKYVFSIRVLSWLTPYVDHSPTSRLSPNLETSTQLWRYALLWCTHGPSPFPSTRRYHILTDTN